MNKISNSVKTTLIQLAQSGLTIACIISASVAFAGSPGDDTTYVDSVHQWGAWELDIEPAAGGIAQPKVQPVAERESYLHLRTNSVAALAPQQVITFNNSTPAVPVPTVTPVTPPPAPVIVTPVVTPVAGTPGSGAP